MDDMEHSEFDAAFAKLAEDTEKGLMKAGVSA
jgi:hypothetical protein